MKLTPEGSYRISCGEVMVFTLAWLGICGSGAWLFYNDIRFMAAGLVLYPFCYKKIKKYLEERHQKALKMAFKDMMISIYSSLSAGATVEESFHRALTDLDRSLKPGSRMVEELRIICGKLERNVPVSRCLADMAKRCRDEDIENFTQGIILGKKQGGDLAGLVRDSVEKIQRRIEVSYEIEGLIGAKQMEFEFMCVIPSAILLYMRFFSADFMAALYGNVQGILLTSVCLAGYGGAIGIGMRILKSARG